MLAVVIVVFLVVAVSAYALTVNSNDDDENGNGPDPPPPKELAPNFVVTSIDGERVALDQYRGRVVILDLMATWCGPCADQMEELNHIYAEYPESQVVILSIGVDTDETDQQLRNFRDQYYANWRFSSDTDDVGTKYDASSIPTMAIIDQAGKLEWRHAGLTLADDLRDIIDPLLEGTS